MIALLRRRSRQPMTTTTRSIDGLRRIARELSDRQVGEPTSKAPGLFCTLAQLGLAEVFANQRISKHRYHHESNGKTDLLVAGDPLTGPVPLLGESIVNQLDHATDQRAGIPRALFVVVPRASNIRGRGVLTYDVPQVVRNLDGV